MSSHSQSLENFTLLIPRPEKTADGLVRSLEQLGGCGLYFPLIELVDTDKLTQLDAALTNLKNDDIVVFVSVPAVRFVCSRLAFLNKSLPKQIQVAVVGDRTKQACYEQSIEVNFSPERTQGSEGLLPCFDNVRLQNKKVLIFRGQDGRDVLCQELQKRGAQVNYVESYVRVLTQQPMTSILNKWRQAGIHAVLISSVSILHALLNRIGAENKVLLENTPIVAFSERIARQCHIENIHHTTVVNGLTDADVIQALQKINAS